MLVISLNDEKRNRRVSDFNSKIKLSDFFSTEQDQEYELSSMAMYTGAHYFAIAKHQGDHWVALEDSKQPVFLSDIESVL